MPLDKQKYQLKQILGIATGVAVSVGAVIGSGILRTPGIVASYLPNPYLIVVAWVLGGVYILCAANTVAELSTMLPKAGGSFVFTKRAYGEIFGFFAGYAEWLTNTCALGYLSIAAGEYILTLFPFDFLSSGFWAIVILLILALIHNFGLRAGSSLQKISSLSEVLLFFVLIFACLWISIISGTNQFHSSSELAKPETAVLFAAFILAMLPVIETYAGWDSPVFLSEENKNPSKSIPGSLFGGVMIVIVIYLLMNLAFLLLLPYDTLVNSKLPAADAAQIVFGGCGSQIVTVIAIVALISIVNAILLYVPRILFALGREGLFFEAASLVNRQGTPAFALAFTLIVAILLILSGSFEILFSLAAFLGVTVNVSVFIALFVLRKKEPELYRPFKAIGYPFIPFLIVVLSFSLWIGFIITNPQNSLLAACGLLISYPIYLWIRKLKQAIYKF